MSKIETPPKVKPFLKSAPKIKEFFWCDFPHDAQLPEFWKRRPVIIVTGNNTLHGTAVVVPCSTSAQTGNKWAFPLKETIDGKAAWAICDKPSTVAVSRLTIDKGGIKRMSQEEFNEMLAMLLNRLPKLP